MKPSLVEIWYSEPCIVCGTAITSPKESIDVAQEEVMLKSLTHYMGVHFRTKHPSIVRFTYVPNPTLHPVTVRAALKE